MCGPLLGIAELAAGLRWGAHEAVLMVWAYYDESGEYSRHQEPGTLMNMSVGGCVAPLAKWQSLEIKWKRVLDNEGLESFHMTDFERWCPPFDFKLPDGSRDKVRHNRLLNQLLDIMLDHIDAFCGFAAPSSPQIEMPDKKTAHKTFLAEGVRAAVRHAALEISDSYDEKVHLVFGQQAHLSSVHIGKYVDFYNQRAGNPISGYTVENAQCVSALQAADIWAYEFARCQRIMFHPNVRYPMRRLGEGISEGGLTLHIEWGLAANRKFKRLSDDGSGS